MRHREIESLLRSEIEGAIAEGWVLAPGGFGWEATDGYKQCCAVGALGRYAADDDKFLARGAVDIASALDIDHTAIAAGFDGRPCLFLGEDRTLYDIGASLARDYLEVSK